MVLELTGVMWLHTAHLTLWAPQAYMSVIVQQLQMRCPTWFACTQGRFRAHPPCCRAVTLPETVDVCGTVSDPLEVLGGACPD